MKADLNAAGRKRPVNLTLNEDLVSEARSMTNNLSGVVESLLSEFIARERRERLQRTQAVEAAEAGWNSFNSQSGSIADEYSSL